MSHELYDPFEAENQSSAEGQYELHGRQVESNPRRPSPRFGPESNLSSSGPSSAIPDNNRGTLSLPMSQSMNHGPDQRRARMDENRGRTIEMHMSRAREEVKPVGKPLHQSIDEGTGCTGLQRNEFCSSSTRMASQPSKAIDYGHTGKYLGGVGDEIGTTRCSKANSGRGGGMLLVDTCDTSKNTRGPLQKHTAEVKSSSLGSSRHQATSVTTPSSSNSSALKYVAPPSHDQTKQLQTRPNQTSQTLLRIFSVPKNDTDSVKTGASKPGPLKEPTSDRQSTSKTQPHANLVRGVHPGRPGLVLIGSNNNSGAKERSKIRSQGSTFAEQVKKQQSQKQPVKQQSKQQKEQKQKGQVMWPPVFSVAKSVPSAVVIPNIIDASKSMQQPMSLSHTTLPTSHWQPPAKVAVFKGLPTLAMMQDYAAASPRIFPHTCSLCKKECIHMKDWVSHQNTSHHLESCTLLRKQYPDWDGEIALGPRAIGKDAKPSTSSSSRYHRASERRREKCSSWSRLPHSTRYTRRSRSRSPRYDRPTTFPYRSRLRSSERRSSPRRRDERRSSPRRSRERQLSPRRYDGRPSRRLDSRRSPPRRNCESRSSADGSSPQQKKSSSAGRLVQKLLETSSASQSLATQSDLEALVKTLAPALLAELAKMKSSSSSSFSSAKKMSTTKPSEGKPSLQSSEASSATTTKTGKSSPPTMVRLEGINSSLSHNDVVTAVEHFGKTKSVVLFRTKLQAIVCFEEEEDAKKLKSIKGFDVKGLTINVVREEETVSNVQMKPPQKKPAMSITTTSTSRTVLVPPPNVPSLSCSPEPSPSGAQTPTTRVETAEPMEVGCRADGKGARPPTTGAVPENSADKPCVIRPTTSETLSTEINQDASFPRKCFFSPNETVSNVQMKPPQKKPTMSITTTSTSRTVLVPPPGNWIDGERPSPGNVSSLQIGEYELCDSRRGGRAGGRGGGKGSGNNQDKKPSQEENQTDPWKSTRGKKEERVEEKEAVVAPPSLRSSSLIHKDPSTCSRDVPLEVQKKEEQVGAARQADIDAASAGQEMQLEHPENQTLEECVEEGEEEMEGWSRMDIKAAHKRRRELVGPEAKRARSPSPCVTAGFKLPPLKPNNPLGQEFVVPKSGYFCNLCSVFYLNESTTKDAHCSSQRHCNNLEKHYQKLEQEP